jgi:hypothetical protein
MAWLPKVNRHVQLLKRVSSSVTLIKPGIITGIALDTNPIIRIGHSGESYGNATNGVPRRTNPNENLSVTKYISY